MNERIYTHRSQDRIISITIYNLTFIQKLFKQYCEQQQYQTWTYCFPVEHNVLISVLPWFSSRSTYNSLLEESFENAKWGSRPTLSDSDRGTTA